MNARRLTATLATTALVATPLAIATASPAAAADREFRYAGGQIDFDVEKDDGRFEVSVDIDDARPGSRWVVVLKQNGNRFYKQTVRADREGDVDIDRDRRDTRGRDTFKLRIKRVGADKTVTRTIRTR
ncbi:hypothetical protein KLP28_10320 [Nocardioidaceae bacterium]|nr:hypothetical protein KLP28_10320 [Nocardioidaceae bacterium]